MNLTATFTSWFVDTTILMVIFSFVLAAPSEHSTLSSLFALILFGGRPEMPEGSYLATSPFSATELKPFGEFTRRGSHSALRLPTGQIIINFNDATSHKVLTSLAKQLGADLISIKGTWTFVPDPVAEEK